MTSGAPPASSCLSSSISSTSRSFSSASICTPASSSPASSFYSIVSRSALWVAVLVLVIHYAFEAVRWVFYALTGVLLVIVLGIFFAYLIAPLIELVRKGLAAQGRDGEPRLLPRQVDQVVAGTALLDQEAQVADRGLGIRDERPQRTEERGEVLRGGLGLRDEDVEVAERGAQVDERGVRLAQRRREQP